MFVISEPKDDGALSKRTATLPFLKLVMMKLGTYITSCTFSPEALEAFQKFADKIDSLIHQYGLTLEFLVGILGKTNGKVVRFSAANALLDLTMYFVTISDEMRELYESCFGQSATKFCPEGALEAINRNLDLLPASRLMISVEHVQSAINFIKVMHN